jgi:DNA-binding SARP family transcriptional activator
MDVLLLGPIEARLDGRTIPLGAHKQRALLALLALHANRPVSSERIIEGLWGEEPPPSAGKMVQLYVSRLRRALPGDGATIVTRDGGYELCLPDEAVDAARFGRLVAEDRPREALALWRGEALADVRTEPFADLEARRLDELRVHAVERAIEEDLGASVFARLRPLPISARPRTVNAGRRSVRRRDPVEGSLRRPLVARVLLARR